MDKFSLYANAFIKGGNPKKGIRVGGIISTEAKDADGETILTKGLDLSYLESGWGKIKYEHDNIYNKEPDNIIGFPDRVVRKSDKVVFEGTLIPYDPEISEDKLTPQEKASKSAHGLLKAIEQHNRTHSKKQRAGWSIEGEYVKKSRNGRVEKAKVVNVVLTTKPRNTTTVATLLKALTVGYGTSPETQTGFGATRKESISQTPKNYKGDSKMYNSKDECYKAMLAQGKSEDEARRLADEWEQKNKKDVQNTIPEEAMKSLATAKDELKKSIDFANEIDENKIDLDANEERKTLEKSIKTITAGEKVDLTDYFVAKQVADVNLVESQVVLDQKINSLAKSVSALAEGLMALAENNEFLAKSLGHITEASQLNAKASVAMLKGMNNDIGLITDTAILKELNIQDNNDEPIKLNKSQTLDVLDKLYQEGSVSQSDVLGYEGAGYMDERVMTLVKSKVSTLNK